MKSKEKFRWMCLFLALFLSWTAGVLAAMGQSNGSIPLGILAVLFGLTLMDWSRHD